MSNDDSGFDETGRDSTKTTNPRHETTGRDITNTINARQSESKQKSFLLPKSPLASRQRRTNQRDSLCRQLPVIVDRAVLVEKTNRELVTQIAHLRCLQHSYHRQISALTRQLVDARSTTRSKSIGTQISQEEFILGGKAQNDQLVHPEAPHIDDCISFTEENRMTTTTSRRSSVRSRARRRLNYTEPSLKKKLRRPRDS